MMAKNMIDRIEKQTVLDDSYEDNRPAFNVAPNKY